MAPSSRFVELPANFHFHRCPLSPDRHETGTETSRVANDSHDVVPTAPRTDVRVKRFVRRLEPRTSVIADVARATGVYCEAIGVTRPSYEQVRLLFHAARERRERRRAALDLLMEVEFRSRPPSDLLHLFDDPVGHHLEVAGDASYKL